MRIKRTDVKRSKRKGEVIKSEQIYNVEKELW